MIFFRKPMTEAKEKSSISFSLVLPRVAALIVGLATFSISLWWLAGESISRSPDVAAKFAAVRGDLWKLAGWARLRAAESSGEQAKDAFERALELSPMDSDAWFGLALATERFGWLGRNSAQALKMSYYTGFNSRSLIADRLLLLARTETADSPELQDLLRRQVGLILRRLPELRPAIEQAYSTATGLNRQLIEAAYRERGEDRPGSALKP